MPTFEFFLDSRGLLTKEFEIDVTATLPKVTVQVFDGDDPVNLTGAAVTFTLRDAVGAAVVLDAAAVLLDATNGIVEYQLADADVDDVGFFFAQFKITISGESYLIPNDSTQRLRLRIGKEDLPAFSSVPATLPVHAGSHDLGGSDQIKLEALLSQDTGVLWVDNNRDAVTEAYTADGSPSRPFNTVEDGVADALAGRVAGETKKHVVVVRPGVYQIPDAKLPVQLTDRIFIVGIGGPESTIIRPLGTVNKDMFEANHTGPNLGIVEFHNVDLAPNVAGRSGLIVKTTHSRIVFRDSWVFNAAGGGFIVRMQHPSGFVLCVLERVNKWPEFFTQANIITGVEFNFQDPLDCLVAADCNLAEIKTNASAIAADIRLVNCRVLHEKITGGEKTQKIRAAQCWSDGVGGLLFDPLDAQDFRGEHTFEIADGNKTINEIHTLSLANTSDTTIQIPAGAIVTKVTVRVIDAVTTSSGTDTLDVGVLGATTRYGSGVAGAAGTVKSQGPSDNQLFYATATAIRLSAPGVETFATGKLSVAITHSNP